MKRFLLLPALVTIAACGPKWEGRICDARTERYGK